MDWDRKTVLVTGAAGGIGGGVADAFERSGATVIRTDLQAPPDADESNWIAADLMDPSSPATVIDFAVEVTGRLDVVVNAAGIQVRKPAREIGFAEWQRLLAVNLSGVLTMCQAALPALVETQGCIVNVGSLSAAIGIPGIVPYGATKGGVTQLTKGLAVEFGGDGVRVNCVAPGQILTNMTRENLSRPEIGEHHLARTPLKRFGHPVDVADAVVFLASRQASFITGAVLPVDGGYSVT